MNNKSTLSKKLQQGATLLTTLVFLFLMTVLTFTATKISFIDILISNNNQDQMVLYQQTENDLKILTTVEELYDPMVNKKFNPLTSIYVVSSDAPRPNIDEYITEIGPYSCSDSFGRATSKGPGTRACQLYDFQVKRRQQGKGAKDRHHRGVGKEVPRTRPSKYSAI